MALNDILVHTDSTSLSEKRFRMGLKLAKRHGATLFCLYSQTTPLSLGITNNKEKRRKLHKKAGDKCFNQYQNLADKAGVKLVWETSKLPRSVDEVTDQLIHTTQHMDMVIVGQYHHKKAAGILRTIWLNAWYWKPAAPPLSSPMPVISRKSASVY